MDINELIYKTETYPHRKQTYNYQKGKVGRRDKLRIWEQHIHTIHKKGKQQEPSLLVEPVLVEPYSTGTATQYFVIPIWETNMKKNIHITESLC